MTQAELTNQNHKKTRVFSDWTPKGGIGKSSLAVQIAACLAEMGKKVLLIEIDMQRNASKTLLSESPEYNITHIITEKVPITQAIYQARENLFVIAADRDLDQAANHILINGRKAYDVLKRAIDSLTGYNVVIFDHSPNWTTVTNAALRASKEILVPVELEPYAIDGIIEMFEKLQDEMYDHELTITGIIPNKVDFRSPMTQTYLSQVTEEFKKKVTPYIRIDKQIPQSQAYKQTIFEFNSYSKSAKDIRKLVDFIINSGDNDNA